MNVEKLRRQLIEITRNNYEFPKTLDINNLADDMLLALKSPDGNLRDRLTLECFFRLIPSGKLSNIKCRAYLKRLIGPEFLLNGLGGEEDDTVFSRAFAPYVIGVILKYNREVDNKFLDATDFAEVLDAGLQVLSEEVDYRGFVDGKGWAESIGHIADFFGVMAIDSQYQEEDLKLMLKGLISKICIGDINHGVAIFRIAEAVKIIINRDVIDEEYFSGLVSGMLNMTNSGNETYDIRLKNNRSEFLFGLSWRLKERFPNFWKITLDAYFELIQ